MRYIINGYSVAYFQTVSDTRYNIYYGVETYFLRGIQVGLSQSGNDNWQKLEDKLSLFGQNRDPSMIV